MKKQDWLYIIFFISIFTACSAEKDKNKKQNPTPDLVSEESKGKTFEMILVMSQKYLNDTLGKKLKAELNSPIEGLPQAEKNFDVSKINPNSLGNLLKQHNNLMFFIDLSDNSDDGKMLKKMFQNGVLEKNLGSKTLMTMTQKDKFAIGQRILFLVAKSSDDLLIHFEKEKSRIIEYFREAERERTIKKLTANGDAEQKKLQKFLKEKLGITLSLPPGYKLVKNTNNFAWLRFPSQVDKNITIFYTDYKDKAQFEVQNIINIRNENGKKYMNNKEIKDSYIDTQILKDFPVISKPINFNKSFATEYKGLWCFHNKNGGGPFIGYAFIDEKNDRFYYIEGFVFAPSQPHRLGMLELETILRTAKWE
jgi:hypothetical protein